MYYYGFQYNLSDGIGPKQRGVDMEYNVESADRVYDVGHRDSARGTPAVFHGESGEAVRRRGR